jgi:DNA polymerase III epsilon subunit-like protein
MAETASAPPKYPKTIVILDTEGGGLSNTQQDSAKGFGLFQLAAAKFRLEADGSLHYLESMNLITESKADSYPDDRPGAKPRRKFYEDYAAEGKGARRCFRIFEYAVKGLRDTTLPSKLAGFLNDDRIGLQDATLDRDPTDESKIIRTALPPEKRGVQPIRNKIKERARIDYQQNPEITPTDRHPVREVIFEHLDKQIAWLEAHNKKQWAGKLKEHKAGALKELEANPWLLEQMYESYEASLASGIKNHADLMAKAKSLGQEKPVDYVTTAQKFSEFSAGCDQMVAHNAMFDFSVLRHMYAEATTEATSAGKPAPSAMPFTLHQIVDTIPLSAARTHRFGLSNKMDVLIKHEGFRDAHGDGNFFAASPKGLDKKTIEKLLHWNGKGPLMPRLQGEQSHDALEDVLITSAYLQKVTHERAASASTLSPEQQAKYEILPSFLKMLSTLPGVDTERAATMLTGKEASSAAHCYAPPETDLTAYLPLKSSQAGKFLTEYLGVMHAGSKHEFEPASLLSHINTDGPTDGVLLNLQKVAFQTNYIFPMLRPFTMRVDVNENGEQKRVGAFRDVTLTPNYQIPRYSIMHFYPRRKGHTDQTPEALHIPLMDYTASASMLSWQSPEQVIGDLEMLTRLRCYTVKQPLNKPDWISGRARFEYEKDSDGVSAPPTPIEKRDDNASNTQWIAVSLPRDEGKATLAMQRLIKIKEHLESGSALGHRPCKIDPDPYDPSRRIVRFERKAFEDAYKNPENEIHKLLFSKEVGDVGGGFGGRSGGGG